MVLNQLQKAACEGVWRSLKERNVNQVGPGLDQNTPEPQARRIIADYVCKLPVYHLPNFILPDLNKNGLLTPGYTRQWNDVCEAGKRHDAHVAEQKAQHDGQRVSENKLWPDQDDSSGHASKENTASEPSDSGEADPDKKPMASPGERSRQKGGLHCDAKA